MAPRKPQPQHKMVGWYDPGQLLRTGSEVLISTIFGKHADRRVLQAIADTSGLRTLYYYEAIAYGQSDFWFDYVSDVGEGFDSTYTIAYQLTRDKIGELRTRDDSATFTDAKRGEILIFGGDEVYPTASAKAYEERLEYPYKQAFAGAEDGGRAPAVFAIPGNHDWYDSLIEFTSRFCRGWNFAGWRTYQNRSYFALKLPHGWWVFGTDMQLASNLDSQQEHYFKTIVEKHFEDGDRVILCNAEPWWITRKMYAEHDPNYKNPRMGFFEGQILRGRIAVHIAGDRHYYRRHEEFENDGETIDPASRSKRQKIVAGGGGAFLHPTHLEGVDQIGDDHKYELKASYPSESESSRLTFGNLKFLATNWKFGLFTGLLYLFSAQAFSSANLGRFGLSEWWPALKAVARVGVYEPIATFWVLLVFAGFYFFTDTHSRRLRYFAGPIHALINLVFAFASGWLIAYMTADLPTWARVLAGAFGMYAAGHIFGSVIMGVYLIVMLNGFGVHHNEAFSSLKIENYKNFLRMRIDSNGDLTILPIGIEKAHKKWKKGAGGKLEPEDPGSIKPFLIEAPVTYVKPAAVPKTVSTPKPKPEGNVVAREVGT